MIREAPRADGGVAPLDSGATTVLVANRGEIACCVLRSAHQLGLRTVAVHTDDDRGALHARSADECVALEPDSARTPYLSVAAVIAAARRTGATLIHPGYGFLSENPDLARECTAAGLTFVGPSAEVIELMGDKVRARHAAVAAGVPVLPGAGPLRAAGSPDEAGRIEAAAAEVGYPLLVKAAAGGGGRGIALVTGPGDLAAAIATVGRQSDRLFGNSDLLLERYVARGRHVEVQVFGRGTAGSVALGDRDCSVQRNRQKIVEEAPAPDLPPDARRAMAQAAVSLADNCSYEGVGTVEFLFEPASGRFFFLEMNTRLQVEHPVTEEITSTDLVALQLRHALGESLDNPEFTRSGAGHAIEVRVCAEDPARNFRPSPGTISHLLLPSAPGIRVETGYRSGDEISPRYDSLICKIIASGPDRTSALTRLREAVGRTEIAGVATNLDLLARILDHPRFVGVQMDTGWVDGQLADLLADPVSASDGGRA
jgi:acetyl/propionyl-CoA carboxylase alpha subunit